MSENADDRSGRRSASDRAADTEHLQDVADGGGCTEIWEHLSENRSGGSESERDAATDSDRTLEGER
ncbi:hypothetical protein [Halomicrococcus sp. SG-WS-1]|uniref:hypothetical protein n=1 Tax=Halomicrococcus sp. SG-WS-1 TaxID=3439057 RepID=UPI003F7A985C